MSPKVIKLFSLLNILIVFCTSFSPSARHVFRYDHQFFIVRCSPLHSYKAHKLQFHRDSVLPIQSEHFSLHRILHRLLPPPSCMHPCSLSGISTMEKTALYFQGCSQSLWCLPPPLLSHGVGFIPGSHSFILWWLFKLWRDEVSGAQCLVCHLARTGSVPIPHMCGQIPCCC